MMTRALEAGSVTEQEPRSHSSPPEREGGPGPGRDSTSTEGRMGSQRSQPDFLAASRNSLSRSS